MKINNFKVKKIKWSKIHSFSAKNKIEVIDKYENNLEELFLLRNPRFKFNKNYQSEFNNFKKAHYREKDPLSLGSWFYFPWLHRVVHFFGEELHNELRTGRNKYLISHKNQNTYYNSAVGVLGMSVGSHIAIIIAMTGGAKRIKIADPDTLSGDNLNRIRLGFSSVGEKKVVLVARQISEINPYSDIKIYDEGITENNYEDFIDGLDIVVEEMDNMYWKLRIREICKKKKIPVIMGTDNGDGVIIDIERFNKDKKYPIFHGLAPHITSKSLKKMKSTDLPKIAATLAGANLAPPEMIYSVSEVGKSLYSWPQLGTAANLCGTAVSYIVRHLLCDDVVINSGRYEVNLDSIFIADWNTKKEKNSRSLFIKKILKEMDL